MASAPAATTKAGGPASGSAASFDFCTLISADEAAKAVGAELLPGRSTPAGQTMGLAGGCQYFGKDNPPSVAATIVQVIVLGTKVPRSAYDQELVGNRPGLTPVSGIGETAVAVPGAVTVFDHGLVLTVQVVNHSVPADTASVTALLKIALGRAAGLA